ncbi:type II toxin-antitoxin system VapC family toxin [Ruegeria faecimaris]|uniref:type II toxin-antitoxin system VapC family toxin n=1 Tax=Ruegeria faecimaris TaxID=686389 RepID=UPI00232DE233|nr:type II toxin-antitoxin system VapC family toxin [Ruegeria faecimaris]
MKPVVLDTNALAMVLTDDRRLPDEIRTTISNAPRTSISAISFYEIGQKVRLGKWDAMAKFAPDLVEIVVADGFDLISLSPDQAVRASLLEWSHRDPFDRMIAAVAIGENAHLASSDAAFDELKDVTRVWA